MNSKEKQITYGFSILRIWMCFEVVLCHFKNFENSSLVLLREFSVLAVPTFMLLSFSLLDIDALIKDKTKKNKRLKRIIIPQIYWTIFYFVIYFLMDLRYHASLENGLSDFFIQLFLGHSINQTAWFQVNLIWLTLLFLWIFKKFEKEKAINILLFLGCVALLFQYSNWNWKLFNMIPVPKEIPLKYITYPLGRFFEMIPYAVIGVLIKQYGVLKKLKEKRRFLFPFFFILIFCIPINQNFFIVPMGYGYQGVYKILMAIVLVSFLCFPDFKETFFIKKIHAFSTYTFGIYFCHNMIGQVIYHTRLAKIFRMNAGSFYDCVVIFLLSFLFCYVIGCIPKFKKLVS